MDGLLRFEAEVALKRIASHLTMKWKETYSRTFGYVNSRVANHYLPGNAPLYPEGKGFSLSSQRETPPVGGRRGPTPLYVNRESRPNLISLRLHIYFPPSAFSCKIEKGVKDFPMDSAPFCPGHVTVIREGGVGSSHLPPGDYIE